MKTARERRVTLFSQDFSPAEFYEEERVSLWQKSLMYKAKKGKKQVIKPSHLKIDRILKNRIRR